MKPARPADVDERLVDVGSVRFADVVAYLVDPGRMVDQAFKDFAAFDDILQVHAVDAAVGMHVDMTVPLVHFKWGQAVDPFVYRAHVVGDERLFDQRVAEQVEKVLLHRAWSGHSQFPFRLSAFTP